jgi:hypothetical protein
VEQLGFVDVGQEGWTHMVRGGDPMSAFYADAIRVLAEPVIAAGLVTRESAEEVYRLLLDPHRNYPGRTVFADWGRKPEG